MGCLPTGWRFWAVGVLAFFASGMTIGTTQYSFGVFVEALEDEYGWSRASINGATSLGFVTYAATSPAMGRFVDRRGVRMSTSVSLAFLLAGWLLVTATTSLPVLYLAFFLLYVGYSGTTMLSSAKIIGAWFPEKKGRMMGIVTAGNNTCGLLMVQVATAVEQAHGWRWAAAVFACVLGAVGLAFALLVRSAPVVGDVPNPGGELHLAAPVALEEVALVLRDGNKADASSSSEVSEDPEDPAGPPGTAGTGPALETPLDMRAVVRSWAFAAVAWGVVCSFWTYGAVLVQMLNHLEAEGMSGSEAATGVSIVAFFGIGSKLFFGRVSEIITARRALMVCNGIQLLALVVFILGGDSRGALYVGIVLYGMGFGGCGALMPLTVMEIFGLVSFASVFGTISLLFVVPGTVGPLLAGLSYDQTDHYHASFGFTAAVFASAIVALGMAPRKYSPPIGRAN